MKKFQQEVKNALDDLFDPTVQEQQQIEKIAEQATRLRSTLDEQDDASLDLTVDLISSKIEERVDNGPKYAWNNWIGTLESFNVTPEGYKIE
jgi:hypothetical protein